MMVGAAVSLAASSFPTAGVAGMVMTPETATTAIARLERASFNHWFTSLRVWRATKNPGISGECVDLYDLSRSERYL
jgi:hypothetical protein